MNVRNRLINWAIFILLSVIWGSSFILIKAGMNKLTAWQVGSLRILCAGLVLFPVAIRQLRQLPKQQMGFIILSGLLGSFFPAFLFCLAETRIDSSLAGILNALTPLFTIITGLLLFKSPVKTIKIWGVVIGFIGLVLLFISKGNVQFTYLSYASLVLLATLLYGYNVNMVGKHLKEVGSLNIAAIAFSFLAIPSLVILAMTGYFQLPLGDKDYLLSTAASATLGILGTAVATILFYMLLKRAGPLFASMVTYGIPFIAITWGLLDGEQITLLQVGSLGIILVGVFLTSK